MVASAPVVIQQEEKQEDQATETETDCQVKSYARQYSEASTNTDPSSREPSVKDVLVDQENQMNTANIRDSRDSTSQTDKWFDAISPSSSKSDIFSSSFTAGKHS